MGGQDGQLPLQVLADQLTLHQPEGADCAPHRTILAHPALGSFLRPCYALALQFRFFIYNISYIL